MKKITIITGHYGSGKTNITANLALMQAAKGKKVTVVDLDFVNPYFRSADFKKLFEENNIDLVSSMYANTNVDIPSISFDLERLCLDDGYVIIDVGGDDEGATALGRYKRVFDDLSQKNQLDMLFVINKYRYLTNTADETYLYMKEIEKTSRQKHTGIINNSNLGCETTGKLAIESVEYAKGVSSIANLPIIFTSYPFDEELVNINTDEFKKIKVYVKQIWEK